MIEGMVVAIHVEPVGARRPNPAASLQNLSQALLLRFRVSSVSKPYDLYTIEYLRRRIYH